MMVDISLLQRRLFSPSPSPEDFPFEMFTSAHLYHKCVFVNMTYVQPICQSCVLSPAKKLSNAFDWELPTALKYFKIEISPICENLFLQALIAITVPRAEDFPFEIFTSAQSGPNLLCVVIGNISQEDILDNLPPGNLKMKDFVVKC